MKSTSQAPARQAKLTPAQVLDGFVEVLRKTDEAARMTLADLLPILARNPNDPRLIAVVGIWFCPAAKPQAQILTFPSAKRQAARKEAGGVSMPRQGVQ